MSARDSGNCGETRETEQDHFQWEKEPRKLTQIKQIFVISSTEFGKFCKKGGGRWNDRFQNFGCQINFNYNSLAFSRKIYQLFIVLSFSCSFLIRQFLLSSSSDCLFFSRTANPFFFCSFSLSCLQFSQRTLRVKRFHSRLLWSWPFFSSCLWSFLLLSALHFPSLFPLVYSYSSFSALSTIPSLFLRWNGFRRFP